MTPPTAEDQDSALAALTGTITERKPETDLQRAMLRLRLVAEAKDRGVSWGMIGAAMGVSAKAAKRETKLLAARTQRDLMLSRNPKPAARRMEEPLPQDASADAVNRIIAAEAVKLVPVRSRPPAVRKHPHHVRRRGR